MKTIKEILKEANRYEDVIELLDSIITDNTLKKQFPAVSMFVTDNGEIAHNISGEKVVMQAALLKNLIEKDSISIDTNELNFLFKYTDDILNSALHNYAVSISHRDDPELTGNTIERIRILEILNNLLVNHFQPIYNESDWYIPNGWKKY